MPHEPHYDYDYRYHEEATDLINILEQQVVPTFYKRGNLGYSEKWIAYCRESMKSIIPRFNSERMVMDYLNKVYAPSLRKHEVLMRDGASGAKQLAAWKQKVRKEWKNVSLSLVDSAADEIGYLDQLTLKVNANLGNLGVEDVRVEMLLGSKENLTDEFIVREHHLLKAESNDAVGVFTLSVPMENCGLLHYRVCVYPYHEMLAHPYEMGFMKWL